MEIRKLATDEQEKLIALYRHLHDEDYPFPAEKRDKIWQKIILNPDFYCMGVFIEGQLVCSCCLILIDNLTRGGRPYGLIENVVTDSEHRRKGYGRMLLQHCLEKAWSEDCYKVMLMTSRLDEQTLRFYEAAGFNRHDKQAFVARY